MLNPRSHQSLHFFLIAVRIFFQKAPFYTQIDCNSQKNFLNQLSPSPTFTPCVSIDIIALIHEKLKKYWLEKALISNFQPETRSLLSARSINFVLGYELVNLIWEPSHPDSKQRIQFVLWNASSQFCGRRSSQIPISDR